ncbi:MAG: glycerol-3-phosphate 1-O-acyltransferase PlsY [Hespellia sp.]|jgi:glycerol-3-phosphate acyltransferase PlsY|nr:glycerol-3-phosphate 1-O-acyltransferase PlsY [Hespellia sp.]
MERILCLVIGYIFGLFQTGYLVGKIRHVDIRKHGSGNAGSTNALRVLGWRAGMATFLGDCFKCVFAVLLVGKLFQNSHAEILPLLKMYAGIGATLGHNFPFYMKFKGGKGIAVMAGLIFSTSWWMTLICLAAFLSVVFLTRYISVGSMLVSLLFAVMIIINGERGGFGMAAPYLHEMYALGIFLMVLAWYRHKANIKRLLSGTENKFGNPHKKENV